MRLAATRNATPAGSLHGAGQRAGLIGLILALFALSCRTPQRPPGREPPVTREGATTPAGLDPDGQAPLRFDTDWDNLSIAEAAWLALERQDAFQIERLAPRKRLASVDNERAVFDTRLSAALSLGSMDRDATVVAPDALTAESPAAGPSGGTDGRVNSLGGTLALERQLASGARIDAAADLAFQDRADGLGDVAAARYSLRATQPLLRDAGSQVQLVRLRQARLDLAISKQLLLAAAELLVAQVEHAAWQFVLADRRIAIVEASLTLAEAQRDEVVERIRIGRLAVIERAAIEAEVAQRREALINARSALERARLVLLRLLGSHADEDWLRQVGLRDPPVVPETPLGAPENAVASAFALRPDLKEARLRADRGELEVLRTRNGMLPRLDAFVSLGYSGYAGAFADAHGDPERREHTVDIGIRFEQALGSRRERALHRLGLLDRQQAGLALRNLEALIQVEVRTAHLEAQRTFDQIDATAATRRLREAALDAETEKLRVGKSTSLMVAQAQRDLLAAQLSEVEAIVNHLIARSELYRRDGTLLARRGIVLESDR